MPNVKVSREQRGPRAWEQLMRTAIEKARLTGDRRLTGMEAALAKGQSEQVLRKFSIICEADLNREFQISKR